MDLDENLPQAIHDTLETIHKEMYDKAAAFLNSHITRVNTLEEVGKVLDEKGGYVKMNWCGEEACELKIKELYQATSRCIDEHEEADGVCPCCGKKAKHVVYFARAY